MAALVLENSGCLAPTDDALARSVLAGMARFFRRGRPPCPVVPPRLRRLLLGGPPRASRGSAARAHRRLAHEIAPVLYDAWRTFAGADADLRALAPRLECPVLFAWATRDRFLPLGRSLPAIRTVPQGRVEQFRCGHAPHLELPDAFEETVERFLATVPSALRPRHAEAGAG